MTLDKRTVDMALKSTTRTFDANKTYSQESSTRDKRKLFSYPNLILKYFVSVNHVNIEAGLKNHKLYTKRGQLSVSIE